MCIIISLSSFHIFLSCCCFTLNFLLSQMSYILVVSLRTEASIGLFFWFPTLLTSPPHGLLLLLLLSRFSCVQLCATPQTAAHQASRPWDSPGKNIGVGCHFLLQCMKVKSEVAQSCLTLSDPMDRSPPGSSVHVIFQARVLEWGVIAFSGQSPQAGVVKWLDMWCYRKTEE